MIRTTGDSREQNERPSLLFPSFVRECSYTNRKNVHKTNRQALPSAAPPHCMKNNNDLRHHHHHHNQPAIKCPHRLRAFPSASPIIPPSAVFICLSSSLQVPDRPFFFPSSKDANKRPSPDPLFSPHFLPSRSLPSIPLPLLLLASSPPHPPLSPCRLPPPFFLPPPLSLPHSALLPGPPAILLPPHTQEPTERRYVLSTLLFFERVPASSSTPKRSFTN